MCKWMNTVIVIFLMHPVDINLTYKMGRNPWSMKLSFPILSSLLPCLFGVVIWIPTFSLYTCLFFSILYKHCRYNLFGNKITFPSRSNVWCSEGCSVNILHYTTVAGLSEVWPLTIFLPSVRHSGARKPLLVSPSAYPFNVERTSRGSLDQKHAVLYPFIPLGHYVILTNLLF